MKLEANKEFVENLSLHNITRVLVAIANVIQAPHMNDKKSVILLNHGLHNNYYNFDKLFNLPKSNRWNRGFVQRDKKANKVKRN